MERLIVVMIQPNKEPYITQIENNINEFEVIVKGPVDVAKFLWSGYRIVCNVNAWYGHSDSATIPDGTSFIVKYQDDFISLTTEEASDVIKALKKRKKRKFPFTKLLNH